MPGIDEEPDVLDVGLGLRPDLTGIGLGAPLLRAACELGRELHGPRRYRLVTAVTNARMQRVATALGFERTRPHSTDTGEFVLMERAA